MNINSHLFLDTLEQVKELLSSPGVASRAKEASVANVISEFCDLTEEYAVQQSCYAGSPEDIRSLTNILNRLASKIEVIEKYNLISLQKLKFLSEVSPKP